MAKNSTATPTPVDRAQTYLEAHDELKDLRWYTLLLFNAFEETMRMYLAWRLTCSENDLPGAPKNNPSALFDLVMIGSKELRDLARLFSEARNYVAHRFHDGGYEDKVKTFAETTLSEKWPTSTDNELVFLARAAAMLSLKVGFHMQEVAARPATPFPTLTHEISFAAEYPNSKEEEDRKAKKPAG